MATGRLATSTPAAVTGTIVYTVPGSKQASFSLNILNRSASTTSYRLAILPTGVSTPTTTHYIEWDIVLQGNEFVERTGLVLGADERLWIYSPTSSLVVNVYGYEVNA